MAGKEIFEGYFDSCLNLVTNLENSYAAPFDIYTIRQKKYDGIQYINTRSIVC
jgi:hypothetical protein